MSRLMRTSEVAQRPVVTLDGEDVAQIKDVVFSADGGAVEGFTLAGRGRFSGPLRSMLSWSSILALGRDAVMILDAQALASESEAFGSSGTPGSRNNVLGSQVLTDSGIDLGTITDVILQVSENDDRGCEVVGYEIESSETLGDKGTTMLIPLPNTVAVSGQHLIVPASTRDFVRNDLAGFGAAVEEFRSQLEGRVR
ncbi:MAG: PRC-barrel domain-containing protein [Actinomycetota bacterium]|nr:PRC-barrel domain-containing protein [Actinomycetota bacterium]